MFSIGSFLEKFRKLAESAGLPRRAVIAALFKNGIELEEKEVKIRDGIAYVHARPAVKNQIYLKKAGILASIEPMGVLIRDIR